MRLIDELFERMVALGRPPGQVLIESLHGAPKDVDRASAALGFRDAAFNISVMAAWLDAALDEQSIEWARATAAATEPPPGLWATVWVCLPGSGPHPRTRSPPAGSCSTSWPVIRASPSS